MKHKTKPKQIFVDAPILLNELLFVNETNLFGHEKKHCWEILHHFSEDQLIRIYVAYLQCLGGEGGNSNLNSFIPWMHRRSSLHKGQVAFNSPIQLGRRLTPQWTSVHAYILGLVTAFGIFLVWTLSLWVPIRCSLDRYCISVRQVFFTHFLLTDWRVCTLVTVYLEPRDFQFLFRTRICLYADRSDLALSATSTVLHYVGSSWSVPTPPVAVWSQAVVLSSDSSSSSQPFSDHVLQPEAD